MLNLDHSFTHFPKISTNRLLLRQPTLDDIDAHFALYSHPKIADGHGVKPYIARTQSEETIGKYATDFIARRRIRWAVILKEKELFIGTCGLHRLNTRNHRGEIGYEIDPNYWGQGLGSEAVWGVLRFAFETVGFHRIEAIVDPKNAASAGLLRKVGFTEEGFLRERYYDAENKTFKDDWIFSMLKPEFEQIYELKRSENKT